MNSKQLTPIHFDELSIRAARSTALSAAERPENALPKNWKGNWLPRKRSFQLLLRYLGQSAWWQCSSRCRRSPFTARHCVSS